MAESNKANLTRSVQLRDGQSASNLFHSILKQTAQRFSDLEKYASVVAEPNTFKRNYVEFLPRFEAVRLSSAERADIATALHEALLNNLVFHHDNHHKNEVTSLQEYLGEKSEPVSVRSQRGDDKTPWRFSLDYEGRHWESLQELSETLVSRRVMNPAAGEALTWLQRQVLAQGGLDLSGRRVVVFGAGAEMASTRLFLEAGAEVLWLDVAEPPAELQTGKFSGTLTWCIEPLDLLLQPAEVLATILAYSDGQPLDLCLYAYAPGQARELRLTGAMSALVEAIPAAQIRSISMLVSPTTASELSAQDVLDIEERKRTSPLWEKSLGALGVMGKPGVTSCRYASVTRTLVNIQGASYQAAQYLGKLMTAEAWHDRGFRVSANTAAITQTRSLDHPVFDAAFGGARALQVETFTPLQSQTINGLLTVHDWLSTEQPVPGKVRVHGGIHTLPYPLDKALRIAAAIGFARSPGLLKGLVS